MIWSAAAMPPLSAIPLSKYRRETAGAIRLPPRAGRALTYAGRGDRLAPRSVRALGIVWIPGLMAGMLMTGANPVYAAIYQFVTLAMTLAASGLRPS